MYVLIINGVVVGVGSSPFDGAVYFENWGANGEQAFWRYDTVRGFHDPATRPFDAWNETTQLWEYDAALFTAALHEALPDYRDDKISNIAVNFGTFWINYDQRTRDALMRKAATLLLYGEGHTIDFKMPDDTWAELNLADVQGLLKVGDAHEQACFTAERQVYAVHETTPFTSIQDALGAFDSYLT